MTGGFRVLLWGENTSITESLRAALTTAGYEVEVVRSEAIAHIRLAPGDYAAVVGAGVSNAGSLSEASEDVSPASSAELGPSDPLLGLQGPAALQRRVALLEGVTRNTEACLAFLDTNFNFVWANSAFVEKSGHTRDELIGRNQFELFPHTENRATFERVRETGEPYCATAKPFVYLDQPERGITYWNWTLTPARDAAGAVCGFDFSLVDVTAEVRARQEVERLRAETSALLEGSRAVLRHSQFQDAARSIFDSCKTLIGAAAGYVAVLSEDGLTNELVFLDAGGLPCTVDPSLSMPLRGLRELACRNGTAAFDNDFRNSEWMKFMPEGHAELDNVLFAPLIIEREVVGILGLANKPRGFTERDAQTASAFGELAAIALVNSRALESLERSEERFRSVAQTANDAIISIDSGGLITFWNRGAETIFGYSSAETVGKPLAMIMPERFRQAHAEGIKRVVTTGESHLIGQTLELAGMRKDGSEFPIELSLARWKTGEEVFFTGIVRDTTERKQAERELSQAREDLEQAYRREHHIADTLQQALIPDVSLDLPGYELAATYKPALKEAEVGGDFYDVFTLPDGRAALVIGDVSGKGLQAAMHTATSRYMLRAYAY